MLGYICSVIVPKRIAYIVWFAPVAVVAGLLGVCSGYTEIGLGALLGGILLVLLYCANKFKS